MVGALGLEPRTNPEGFRGCSNHNERMVMVGALGLEPRTNSLRGYCSNQLS